MNCPKPSDDSRPGTPVDRGEPVDVAVIGAGISGLIAARHLADTGRSVVVLDKGRGVGGRMATRRSEGGGVVYDHGAQAFSLSGLSARVSDSAKLDGPSLPSDSKPSDVIPRESTDRSLIDLLDRWKASDVLREWDLAPPASAVGSPSFVGPRWRGDPAMTALPKHLAEGMDVRLRWTVSRLSLEPGNGGEHWLLECDDPAVAPQRSRALVVTTPVPQALSLWERSGLVLEPSAAAALGFVRYHRTLTLLLELDGPSRVPAPGGLSLESEPIAWIGDNQQKGVSPAPSLTIHAAPLFSRAYWDDLDAAARILSRHAEPWIGSDVRSVQVHRWRYSHPVRRHPERCLMLRGAAPVAFAGDAFGIRSGFHSQVEEAALSGLAAAQAVESSTIAG